MSPKEKTAIGEIIYSPNSDFLGGFQFLRSRGRLKSSSLAHKNVSVEYSKPKGIFKTGTFDLSFSFCYKYFLFPTVKFTYAGRNIYFYDRLGGSNPDKRSERYKIVLFYVDGKKYLYGVSINVKHQIPLIGLAKPEMFQNDQINETLGIDISPLVIWSILLQSQI